MSEQFEAPGALPGMTPCHWGSVNQWECDENDHLNVRYYACKINEAVQILLSRQFGIDAETLPGRIRGQHIRFLNEARAATPLRVDCAVAHQDESRLSVVSLMHENVSGRPLAGFVSDIDVSGLGLAAAGVTLPDVPEPARPRGIDPAALPAAPQTWDEARDAGYRIVGRGVIARAECDDDGQMLPYAYVGRISDGMPNLWGYLNPPQTQSAQSTGELGGAALEQRLDIIAPLRRGAVYSQLSGVRALGNKTQQMAHLIFDESRQRVAATMEAVGLAMDLETRRAVPISAERRQHLEGLLLRG
ncbi:MAG: acyl-ACP thioesterase [Gammaproteobacteria bacterium]|nr:acyl-ACP thioesterase [Gammaproteobacteria bacterium]